MWSQNIRTAIRPLLVVTNLEKKFKVMTLQCYFSFEHVMLLNHTFFLDYMVPLSTNVVPCIDIYFLVL